ncbi:MAG: hypothetical protein ACT4QD_03395 [Acidobacteriota bacterium]
MRIIGLELPESAAHVATDPKRVYYVGSTAFASPKSSTFTHPVGPNLDVRGLEIAVDNTLIVRSLQRFGDLARGSSIGSP